MGGGGYILQERNKLIIILLPKNMETAHFVNNLLIILKYKLSEVPQGHWFNIDKILFYAKNYKNSVFILINYNQISIPM